MDLEEKKESLQRIENFDFLRGFFIFLALHQHFCYYLNYLYRDFFRETDLLHSFHGFHSQFIGTHLPMDQVTVYFGLTFIPWVSQVYLTMAAFNLAKRSQPEFKNILKKKLFLFGSLFLIFLFENFVVAPDLGQALSLYPIQTWMIVLSIISLLYSRWGTKAVIGLLLLSLLRGIFPIDELGQHFEHFIQNRFHPSFEYDARIEYFLTSGCLGFLLGRIYFSSSDKLHSILKVSLASFIAFSVYYLFGPDVKIELNDIFLHEHQLITDPLGAIGIWSEELLALCLFLLLSIKNINIRLPLLNWLGKNSLLVFFFHRIYFIHIHLPLRLYLSTMTNNKIENNVIEIYSAILICSLGVWIVKKLKLIHLLTNDER